MVLWPLLSGPTSVICGCVHVGVYMWVCTCGCVHVGVYMCVCTCGCVHVGVYMWVYMWVCTCGCTCGCVHVDVCMWVCTCGCVHEDVYMRINYMRMCAYISSFIQCSHLSSIICTLCRLPPPPPPLCTTFSSKQLQPLLKQHCHGCLQ